MLERYGGFADFPRARRRTSATRPGGRCGMSETSGRPLGSADWLAEIEASSGRELRRGSADRSRGALLAARIKCI